MAGSGREGVQLNGNMHLENRNEFINAGRFGFHQKGEVSRIEGTDFSGAARGC